MGSNRPQRKDMLRKIDTSKVCKEYPLSLRLDRFVDESNSLVPDAVDLIKMVIMEQCDYEPRSVKVTVVSQAKTFAPFDGMTMRFILSPEFPRTITFKIGRTTGSVLLQSQSMIQMIPGITNATQIKVGSGERFSGKKAVRRSARDISFVVDLTYDFETYKKLVVDVAKGLFSESDLRDFFSSLIKE